MTIFGISMRNTFKHVQTCLVLEYWALECENFEREKHQIGNLELRVGNTRVRMCSEGIRRMNRTVSVN